MGEIKAPTAVLKGYAGVGKSVTVGELVVALKMRFLAKFIGVTAPTHKAVKVLRKNAVKDVQYRTIHSMLALKEVYDDTTGEISYAPDKFARDAPPIASLRVLILDEVSMLQDDLFHQIVPWVKKGLKVIFTGDPAQIPPVKLRDCIPFLRAKEWGMLELELTEIMRQKDGNPILEFATEIRSDYQTGEFIPVEKINEDGSGIHIVGHASAEERDILEKHFTSQQFKEDPDHMKVIAWRNKTVDIYNNTIRKLIYKDVPHLPDIMEGEKLIMDKPYIIHARNIIPTNEEVEVLSADISSRIIDSKDFTGEPKEDEITTYNVLVKYFVEGEEHQVRMDIVHETSRIEFKKITERMRRDALNSPSPIRGSMWRQYYSVIDKFSWTKYNYAITGHKSQGSTYDYALVLKWDIDYNRDNIEERNRILYVACTRPRYTLFIEK